MPETGLSAYLKRAYPALPGWALRTALQNRDVRVNGERVGAEAAVRGGDEIALYLPDKFASGALRVLLDEGGLIAVEKPAGLPVDRDEQGVGEDTALKRLQAIRPGARLIHRLDAGTGGVLLAAATDEAYGRATDAFRERRVTKLYRCVAAGTPAPPEGRLTAYLEKRAAQSKVFVHDAPRPGALPIETGYRLLRAARGLSYLEIALFTGRTHQIRAHLAHAGHPLVGDDKYGDRDLNRALGVREPMLWCWRMELFGLAAQSEPPFDGYV